MEKSKVPWWLALLLNERIYLTPEQMARPHTEWLEVVREAMFNAWVYEAMMVRIKRMAEAVWLYGEVQDNVCING